MTTKIHIYTKLISMGIEYSDIVIMVIALAIGGFVKGVTGLGLPAIAIPVMAGFLGVEHAVIVMVIPPAILNAWLVWTHRDQALEVKELPKLLIWGCLGALVGTWILVTAKDLILSIFLALWILVYLAIRFVQPDLKLSQGARQKLSPGIGLLAGTLQTSTGISLPIVATYFHALVLEPKAYIFAISALFFVLGTVHFGTLVALNAYTPVLLIQSTLALLPALATIPLGIHVSKHIDKRLFDKLLAGVLLLSAIKILYEAWETY
jgi:uncharacterized membrane protein YfcA